MAITYEQFTQRLVASGLLSAEELGEAAEKLAPNERGKDPQALARQLITAGKLTKHQATALYKGETKHLVMGNYVILDKLGEGGMGEVYRARHKVMEREVALKVLPAAMVNSPDAAKRFQREVRAAAKLEHQNIVVAYDADQAAGRHFLVMQFVDGRDLSGIVKQNGPMTIEQAIDCCTQAARGLAYAHSRGVIHRDIKPSNLLLDKNGTIKILDMGLARLADGGDDNSGLGSLTQSGQIMGTVDYMAPEQAENTREADHRADIYSLGCTLYVLLTAKAPYQGATVLQKMMAHQQKPVPKLSDARGDASPKLDAVLAKLLAKKPDERYQTMDEVIVALASCLAREEAHAAGALAAGSSDSHLTAFLDKLAHQERPAGTTRVSTALGKHEETINRQPAAHGDDTGTGITRPPRAKTKVDTPGAKRPVETGAAPRRPKPRWLSSAIGAGLLTLGVVMGLAALLISRAWSPPEDDSPSVATANGGMTSMGSDESPLPTPPRDTGSGSGTAGAPKIVLRKKLTGHTQIVRALSFHPNSQQLASGASGGQLYLWDAAGGLKLGELSGHARHVHVDSLAFATDGERLVSSDGLTSLKVWDVAKRSLISSTDERFGAVAFSPDGNFLATGGHGASKALRDPATLAVKTPLEAYDEIKRFAFSHDNKRLVACTGDRLDLHQLPEGKRTYTDQWHQTLSIAFSDDDHTLAVAGEKYPLLRLIDVTEAGLAMPARRELAVSEGVKALAWLPGNRYLVCAMKSSPELQLWDTQTSKLALKLTGHTKPINAIALSPDGRTLATAGEDFDVILWDVNKGSDVSAVPSPKLTAHLRKTLPESAAGRVVVSPDGKLLAARHRGAKKIKVWNAETGAQKNSFDTTLDASRALAFLPNPEVEKLPGGAMLAAGEDHGLGIFELPRGTRTLTSESHKGNVAWIAGSRNNQYIATAGGMGDAFICLWTLQGNAGKTNIGRHGEFASSLASAVAFNADDTLLASGGNDGKVRIYELPGGKEIKTLDVGREVHCVAFSPDGRLLASGDRTPCVKLWHVATGVLAKTLTDFDKDLIVNEVAFSPDGRLLAAAEEFGRGPLRVFDLALGGEPLVMTAAPAHSVAFLPTGHTLVTADETTGVQLWDLDVPEIESTIATFTAPNHGNRLQPLANDNGDYCFTIEATSGKTARGVRNLQVLRSTGRHKAIHFSVDDTVMRDLPANGVERIVVRATVLDEKLCNVMLRYDAHSDAALVASPSYRLSGTGHWVELEWELAQDPRLANRMSFGGDFSIGSPTTDCFLAIHSVAIMRIRVKPRAFTNALGMQFVRVPAGKSWLGGGGGKPGTNAVEFEEDFYLGKYEVTQGEWIKIMGTNPSNFQRTGGGKELVKKFSDAELQEFPVDSVTWEECREFVQRLNEQATESGWIYRLPTAAQWEYACRGGPLTDPAESAFDFYSEKPTNHLLPDMANASVEWRQLLHRTSKVGSYPPNRLGLCDMHGNVWERCDDRVTNEKGESLRPIKGGGWFWNAGSCAAAHQRLYPLSSARDSSPGLRVARVRSTNFVNSLGMEFVRVPAGKSWLGGGGGKPGDKEVTIPDDFYLGKYEVTQAEWQKVMGTNPSNFQRTGGGKDRVEKFSDAQLQEFPVDNVTWTECQEFVQRLNEQAADRGWVYRLPTVAEWEYACRGGPLTKPEDSAYSFYLDQATNTLSPDKANVRETALSRTLPAGSYAPNRLGLYDLHGNVWEWCDDRMVDGKPSLRTARGGGWATTSNDCRAGYHNVNAVNTPSLRHNANGLRLARVRSVAKDAAD